jgi:hypothetical protein
VIINRKITALVTAKQRRVCYNIFMDIKEYSNDKLILDITSKVTGEIVF